MNKTQNWIKKVLNLNKWFVIPAIFVLYFSSAILMLVGIFSLYELIIQFIDSIKDSQEINHVEFSANFIGIIDIYILAIVLYTLAVGIYKLFIGNKVGINWIRVNNINDLKSHLAKMSVLFLCTMIIQKITEWKEPVNTLYFAVSISLISGVLIWYTKHLDDRKDKLKEERERIKLKNKSLI